MSLEGKGSDEREPRPIRGIAMAWASQSAFCKTYNRIEARELLRYGLLVMLTFMATLHVLILRVHEWSTGRLA